MPRGSKPGERRGGRKAGTPNKASADARAAIAKFVDRNSDRLQGWLDAIAEGVTDEEGKVITPPNPVKAFELFQSVIEYHVPKLARTELTGKDGGPLQVNIVDPTRRAGNPTSA